MWELDYKESWVLKNWCIWTVVLGKIFESPFDCKEIKWVHSKGNQSCIYTGNTDAEAETPVLWPPDVKNWLIGKDPDAGKDGRQEEEETTEDEMVALCHQLNGHEFEQALGVHDGQGSLTCCCPRGHKESDTIEGLNWTEYTPGTFLPGAKTTQRDGMGRKEGGGFRMGNTCIPVADSFWYLAKLIQLCKV